MPSFIQKIIFVAESARLKRYALLVILMLLTALLEAIGVGVVLPFLAAVADPSALLSNPRLAVWLGTLGITVGPKELVVGAGGVMILLVVLKNALAFASSSFQSQLLYRERAYIARKLFAHYLYLPYSLHLKKNIAGLIHVAVGVSTNFTTVYMASLFMILAESLVCIALVGLLFLVSVEATLYAGFFVLVIGGLYAAMTRVRTTSLGDEQNRLVVAANKCLIEGLSALKETRVFGAAPQFLKCFDQLSEQYTKASVKMQVFAQLPKTMVETVFIVAIVGAVIFLAIAGQNLQAILPTLVLFGMAFLRMLPSYNRILVSLTNLRLNQSALDVLHDELREVTKDVQVQADAPIDCVLPNFEKVLEMRQVNYRYPESETYALQDISLVLNKGESIALVGKSGAGKTTLVDLILGLLEPASGSITLDGKEMLGSSAAWRHLLGYIPQTVYLMDDTLRRNIAFGVDDQDIDEAALMNAVEAAQLGQLIRELPEGLETNVGDRGIRLSGGQKQRVGIARALYHQPEILVLDEATSALDVETEAAVSEAIEVLGRSKTLIIVAHRLATVKACDRLYLIDEGRIADSGTYSELVERSSWFRKINELLS